MKEILTLSDKLKIIRSMLGVSASIMAKKLNCSMNYYLNLELGKVKLNDDVASSLKNIIKVKESFLYGDIEKGLDTYDVFIDSDLNSTRIDLAGLRLKELRKELHITQEELSTMLNMKRINVSKLENNKWKMTEKIAIRIGEALNIGYRYLLYGIENEKYYPCNQKMINFLNSNEKVRKMVFEEMNKNN